MISSRLSCPAALLFLVACGGSGSSSIAQADLARQYAAAECKKVLSCCSGTPGGPTEANCEAKVSASIQAGLTTALANAHVTYDGAAAGSCVAQVSAATCEDVATGEHTPACDLVLNGTQANGAACSAQAECKSQLCTSIPFDNNGNATGPGVCAAKGTAGQPCPANNGTAYGSRCAAGSYETNTNNVCTCAAAQANGAHCGDNVQCSSGYCDDGNPHVCAAYPQISALPTATCQAVYSSF